MKFNVEIEGIYDGCFRVLWDCEKGFGQIDFFKNENGQWMIDNETLSRKYLKEILSQLVDSTPLIGEME